MTSATSTPSRPSLPGKFRMSEHLVFVLSAPMAAFGTYAGHERRGSDLAPPRSAILGLLGAALGIDRTDAEGQTELRRYRTAVRPLTESAPLRDYHTVQTVPGKIKRPNGRRAAIEAIGHDINTTITIRDYRTDVAVAIAVWGEDVLRWPLPHVAMALRCPAFVLYLGRKSCPLAAPLDPRILRAPDPIAALYAVSPPEWLSHVAPGAVTCDPFPGGAPDRIEIAPVEPLDRVTWHFSQGEVWCFEGEIDA